MKTAGAAIAGLAVGRLFAGFIDDARESARVSRLTAQVIKTTGGAAHITAQQVGELATAISNKTGVDDEAVQSASNLLLTFTKVRNEVGKGNDVFDQATQAAVDMAAVLGGDATSQAKLLGKALNDPIKGLSALSRAGVSFTAEQKEQIKTFVEAGDVLSAQKIILQELGTEFGGAAAAASDPLQRLGTIAGNLGEDIGGLLLPVISDLADFVADDMIPAIRDGASWLGDNFGPAVGVVKDAIVAHVEVGADILGFFTDLPGPVQLGVVALGAIALLKSPVKDALETIALKALYAKDAFTGVSGAAGGLKKIGSGLLGAFGGPLGLAITGVTVGLGFLIPALSGGSAATEEITRATQDYAGALEQANGVITTSVRQAAAKAAQDAGLLDVADDLGISLPTVTSAITNQGEALDETRARLREYIAQHTTMLDANTRGLDSEGEAAQGALDALNALSGQTGTSISDQQQLAEATGEASVATVDAAADAKAALEQWLQSLQNVSAGFIDPLATYKTLLQEAAQATADATSSAEDSWSDYADSTDVSLDDLAQSLQDQITAQQNWRANIVAISQAGGTEVAGILADMGVEGAGYVQEMVDAIGTEDFPRMRDLMIQEARLGGSGAATELDNAMKVMAAIGAEGAHATAAGIARELGLGTDEVKRIAAQYGIDLAYGINPILAALDRPSVHLSGLNGFNTGGGFADGGWTGPGGKFTPAGFVHGNEYVEPTESLAYYGRGIFEALHKRTIPREMIAGLPGYANGGFVTEADIPRPYSTSPYGAPISTAGDAAMDAEYSAAAAFVRESGPWGRGLSWARTQVGKPYIWGGVGPTGYDCSGFMSAITNVILGQSPYSRRGSTANFPWAGFASGDGSFTVGSTPNAGGGIGHMAGTLLGVNVESAGGVGVRVGSSARGAHDGLFGTRAHLATYDRGGVLPPGLTLAYNGTGKDEYVSKGMGGPVTITGTLRIDGDGLAHIVDGRIDQAFGDVHDRALYAGGN